MVSDRNPFRRKIRCQSWLTLNHPTGTRCPLKKISKNLSKWLDAIIYEDITVSKNLYSSKFLRVFSLDFWPKSKNKSALDPEIGFYSAMQPESNQNMLALELEAEEVGELMKVSKWSFSTFSTELWTQMIVIAKKK